MISNPKIEISKFSNEFIIPENIREMYPNIKLCRKFTGILPKF